MEHFKNKKPKPRKQANDKKRSLIKLICVVVFTAMLGYVGSYGITIGSGAHEYRIKSIDDILGKGLDLVGGVSLLQEIEGEADSDTVNRTIEMLNLRLNKFGVSETTVAREGDKRIRIEVPGEDDAEQILNTIGKTGELVFKDPDDKVILTGKDVKEAKAGLDETNQAIISLEFTDEGKAKFKDATSKNLGKVISIEMDGEVLTAPTVQSTIVDGKAQITGNKTIDEANKIASIIQAGALPVKLKTVETKTVSGTLGIGVLEDSVKAGAVALVLVTIFMIAVYKRPGVLASIALSLYIILLLILFGISNVTLTLSGIAGFLLTVGMALDANVLIFERIKEELRDNQPIKMAVDSGFKKALNAIIDSNITTLISGFILYYVGSGAVKGFAMTLILGILLSIFTALTVTQTLLKWSVKAGLIKTLKHFGVKEGKTELLKINILEKTKLWFTISIIVLTIGFGSMFIRGFNYGIDFKGGTLIEISMGKTFNDAQKKEIIDIVKAQDKDAIINAANNNTQIDIKSNADGLDEKEISQIFTQIKEKFDKAAIKQDFISGTIGKELKTSAVLASVLSVIGILIYVAFRFHFSFGMISVIALIHDVLITLSMYSIFQIVVDTPFIAAILTVLGYSINASIVVFDRLRENIKRNKRKTVDEVANESINQTMTRNIYTTLTTLITITTLTVMVPPIRNFGIPLIIGIISGAYSSIFLATPLWSVFNKKSKKKFKV